MKMNNQMARGAVQERNLRSGRPGSADSKTPPANLKGITKFEVPISDCCNEPVTRVGFNFYCMQCHKACKVKDTEKTGLKGGNE